MPLALEFVLFVPLRPLSSTSLHRRIVRSYARGVNSFLVDFFDEGSNHAGVLARIEFQVVELLLDFIR